MDAIYKPMSLPMKVVLWFVVVNAYLGAFSLIVFPANTQSTWFWSVTPPINSRLFGVLYLAAGSLVLYAVLRGRWEPARSLTAMVPAFTGLMLLTTLLHQDRFDQGAELYYWLMVYVVAPVSAIVFYRQHERGGATWEVVSTPTAPAARVVAVALGAAAGLFGVVAYLFPDLVIQAWPWPISPLMVRVFVSWLGAFVVGLLWFAVDRDWGRLRPTAALLLGTAALFLLVLVVHWGDLNAGVAGTWGFGIGVALIGALGAFLLWRQHDLAPGRRQLPAA